MLTLTAQEVALVNAVCAAVFMNEQHRSADCNKDLEKIFSDVAGAMNLLEVRTYDIGGQRFVQFSHAFDHQCLEVSVKPRPAPAKPLDTPDVDPDPGTPGAPEIPKLAACG